MKKFRYISLMLALFSIELSLGEAANLQGGNEPEYESPILGVLVLDKSVYVKLDDYCDGIEGKKLEYQTGVFFYGKETCKSGSGNKSVDYYLIGYKGKSYYATYDEVYFVLNRNKEQLERLPTSSSPKFEENKQSAFRESEVFQRMMLKNAFKNLNKTKASGVAVLKNGSYEESEYSEGTGYEIEFFNSSTKTIKYITTNVMGLNAVNDPVRAGYGKGNIVTIRGIGPIKPEETASYKKTYAWNTDIVERTKLVSIKIEYMDGTSKLIKNPNSLVIDDKTYQLIFVGED